MIFCSFLDSVIKEETRSMGSATMTINNYKNEVELLIFKIIKKLNRVSVYYEIGVFHALLPYFQNSFLMSKLFLFLFTLSNII